MMFPRLPLRHLPLLLLLSTGYASGEELFKVDFTGGAAGDNVPTAENALPDKYPATELTYVNMAQDVSFKLADSGALPGQYALLTDRGNSNASFFLRWGEDAEDKVVSSGVLTVRWTMNFVSGNDGNVSFQVLRPDLQKEAGRLARLTINSSGSIKIGGSTQSGSANDTRVTKQCSQNAPHQFVWTLDYATGVQTLRVDDGSLLDYSSEGNVDQQFYNKAPAVAVKVEVRGDDAVVAFDDISVAASEGVK